MTINDLIIKPLTITFITTYKCSASCTDCCFNCNPKRKETLDVDDIIKYINEATSLYDSIKVMVLTGGEAFLLNKKLEPIIAHAQSKGLTIRIVSNAYWAKSYRIAYNKLKWLASIGLKELNVSTGDDHQQYVPLDNIVNAICASLDLDLTTVVNVESASDRSFTYKQLIGDNRIKNYTTEKPEKGKKLQILNGIWIPLNHNDNTKQEIKKDCQINYSKCTNLFNNITIDPNHHMLACCGITVGKSKYLDLGDVRQHSIKKLYESQFRDLLKIWLYTEGPIKIIEYVNKKTSNCIRYSKSSHMCQLCYDILNSPRIIDLLKKNYKDIYSNVIFKYLFNNKTN